MAQNAGKPLAVGRDIAATASAARVLRVFLTVN